MASRRELLSDIAWSVVALGIVIAGVVGFRVLGALREPVVAAPVERIVPPVVVAELTPWTDPIPVVAEGFVSARRQIEIAAESPGRIVELASAVSEHGDVRAGTMLARLDDRNAQAAVERALADIDATRARISLNATQLSRTQTLRQRGVVSQDELDRVVSEQSELSGQIASLQSALNAARIALDQTRIVAPFDGRILNDAAEQGDVVNAGQTIATLFTPDALDVVVPLEESSAALVPGLFTGGAATATIKTHFAGRAFLYAGKVSQVGGALDPLSRSLAVTIALGEPLPVTGTAHGLTSGTPPALVNAWAEVTIEGSSAREVHAVPSAAVRQGNTVWLARNNALEIIAVDVVHAEGGEHFVVFADGIVEGARLITSLLAAPVNGMPVNVLDDTTSSKETRLSLGVVK